MCRSHTGCGATAGCRRLGCLISPAARWCISMPASWGFVLPWHGIVIGLVAGSFCFWPCTKLKQQLGYDDSLDVFGVHGVGGATGTLLTGVFAAAALTISPETPTGNPGLLEGNP